MTTLPTDESIRQQRVYDLLRRIPTDGLPAVKQLFWSELNYDRVNEPLSWRDWPRRVRETLQDVPVLLAQAGSQWGHLDIIYCRLAADSYSHASPLSLTAERMVIGRLLADHPYALFVFSDADERNWHLVNVKIDAGMPAGGAADGTPPRRRVFRRISVGPYERLRTAAERIAMLDLSTLSSDLFGLSPLSIQHRHDEAFDVEAVTARFFQEYRRIFAQLQEDLHRQTGDNRWAHDYALQFLNRLMFLYYVQRKRWLGDDPDFISTFWRAYRQAGRPADTFFDEWLSVLFFEAFNKQFQAGRADRQYLPQPLRDALALAPYLNGGLFIANELDRQHQPTITDACIADILAFLDGYNLTISEDTPLDQEVAVDPEMIGKVYESLVNVSAEVDERGAAGIFYTPRIEIDLMCRLSLAQWLINRLGHKHRNLLYELIFAFGPEDQDRADAALADLNLWPCLDELLSGLIVLDPACGSGSFLVGMLYVLDDLVARANRQLGREQTPYERKKRIVGSNLYGVDVMDWAVHVAELRLWLQLVIDTDLAPAELQFRPLLPNLSFKIRCGDSLVQEVGGLDLSLHRRSGGLIPPSLKGQITRLKAEKLKFYNNDPDRKYRSVQAMQTAELTLFRDLLKAQLGAVDERIQTIHDILRPQVNLFGEIQTTQLTLDRAALEQEAVALQADRELLTRAREAIRTAQDVPFVWDIAFVELFSGERGGVDIVIGNPPYVRQEKIHDPKMPVVSEMTKKAYKDRLAQAVYTAWPQAFGYDWNTGRPRWKLDAKSDLYIYFYLYSLALLDEQGVLCFITSNSWLDVGYGKDLQEFLLTRGQIHLIIDNQARRSFASADVNTVIVLLSAAQDSKRPFDDLARRVARFAMFKMPFEAALDARLWQAIEAAGERTTADAYRVFPLTQAELLKRGMDAEKKQFAGDKWGGKYLRAPDIYWTILDKGKGKLVRLGDIADVRRGFTTGANEFFYLDERKIAEWGIEEEFVRPVVKSPREVSRIVIDPADLHSRLLMCHRQRQELAGTGLLEYIRWGESQGYHQRPSCRGRTRWWDLGERQGAKVNCNYLVDKVMRFFAGYQPFFVSDNFQELHSDVDPMMLSAACNSSVSQININVTGRSNFGDGLLKIQTYEVADIVIPDPRLLIKVKVDKVIANAQMLNLDDPDRRALDDLIFDLLGLTAGERDAVYEAVVGLVAGRLSKAGSLK